MRQTIPIPIGTLDIGPVVEAYIAANPVVQQVEIPAHPSGPGNRWPLLSPVNVYRMVDIAGEGAAEEPWEGGTWIEQLIDGNVPTTSFFIFHAGARGSKLHKMSLYQGSGSYHVWEGKTQAEISALLSKMSSASALVHFYQVPGKCSIDDVHFALCGRGVSFQGSGRGHIGRISGCFMQNAAYFDHCTDVVYVGSIHAWSWFTDKDINPFLPEAFTVWQTEHLETLVINRCDGADIGTVFCINALSGITLANSGNGGPTNIVVKNLYADFARFGLFLNNCHNADIDFQKLTHWGENFTIRGGVQLPYSDSVGIYNSTGNQVHIGNLRVQGTGQCAVRIGGYNGGTSNHNIVQIEYLWCPYFGGNPTNGVALLDVQDAYGVGNNIYVTGFCFYNPANGPQRTLGSVSNAYSKGDRSAL